MSEPLGEFTPSADPLVPHTLATALTAFGPGWRDVLLDVFRSVVATANGLRTPDLRMSRVEGRLRVHVDGDLFARTEDWWRVQTRIMDIARRTARICEVCGREAYDPEPRRSTRVHCRVHAIDWALGVDEPTMWATPTGPAEWRTGYRPASRGEEGDARA
jgi:hypothetical protein